MPITGLEIEALSVLATASRACSKHFGRPTSLPEKPGARAESFMCEVTSPMIGGEGKPVMIDHCSSHHSHACDAACGFHKKENTSKLFKQKTENKKDMPFVKSPGSVGDPCQVLSLHSYRTKDSVLQQEPYSLLHGGDASSPVYPHTHMKLGADLSSDMYHE